MTLRFSDLLILTGLLALTSVAQGQQLCLSENQSPSTTPTSRFTDHGDGTVTDTETGLMWAKCQLNMSGSDCSVWTGQQFPNWGNALLNAEASTLAGYSDWRLPNIKELDTIIEQRCANPAINLVVFPNTANTEFWSSSPSVNAGVSWTVQFITGDSQSVYGRNELHAVRLVRDGS